jgi:hypothetical protein
MISAARTGARVRRTLVNPAFHEKSGEASLEEAGRGLSHWLKNWRRILPGRARTADEKEMSILETLDLGLRHRVLLLRCGEERFLVGTGPAGVQAITRIGNGFLEDSSTESVVEKLWP